MVESGFIPTDYPHQASEDLYAPYEHLDLRRAPNCLRRLPNNRHGGRRWDWLSDADGESNGSLSPLSQTRNFRSDVSEGEAQAQPGNEYETAKPTAVPVWYTRPLPSSENGRFLKALAQLELNVKGSNDPRIWRYLCWFAKLRQSGVDDRVIRWGSICPTVGVIPTVVGACDITLGWLGKEGAEKLWKNIQTVGDVDAAGPSLGILTYLKSDIVVTVEMTALPVEGLRSTHDDVLRTIKKLGNWADLALGGSSGMPKEYVSIKDWIGQRQRDPKSIYSCM